MVGLSPLAQQYKEALGSELKNIDRESIKFLKDLAEENKHDCQSIIFAVQEHLYESKPDLHLATLYLVDCIVKVVKGPYVTAFSAAIPAMFRFAWDRADSGVREKLEKMARTWQPILTPNAVLAVNWITGAGKRSDPRMRPPVTPPPPLSPPRMAVPLQQPHRASPPHGVSVPGPVPMRRDPRVAPRSTDVLPTPPSQAAYAAPQQQSLLALGAAPPPVAVVVPFPMHRSPVHGYQAPASTSYTAPPPVAAPAPKPAAPPAVQAPSAVQASSEDIMAALMSLGTKLAGASAPAAAVAASGGGGGNAGGGAAPADSAPAQTSGMGKVIGALSFNASILKEEDPAAIEELLDASEQTRRRFRDRRFLRTRRIKAAQAAGTPLSQGWFYGVDDWLRGTKADGAEVAQMPQDDDDEMAAPRAEEDYNVEEDESQPDCAICGEPFERWYDPDTDKWFYSGAVILSGDEAARHDVMDGSIVKVAALAGQPSKLGLATRGLAATAASTGAGSAGAKRQADAEAGGTGDVGGGGEDGTEAKRPRTADTVG